MTKQDIIARFDPSGIGLKNGHFIGLPFTESMASIVLLPVPWDVTVSFCDGTSTGPQNILECSSQLDLYDPDVPDAWKIGIYMRHLELQWLNRNEELRPLADALIEFMENGGDLTSHETNRQILDRINEACEQLKNWVYEESLALMTDGKKVGIVGGEHSVPLGFLEALATRYEDFGILQIDAHQDLREAYEGFSFSHASIFYNALKIKQISKLVQVGIRDNCEAEMNLVRLEGGRIETWMDSTIRERQFTGQSFGSLCEEIISALPHHVYISFDIDGLTPSCCPNTGTPVPGGLTFEEAMYLIRRVVASGREIIGFDLCEVAGIGHDWDGNVGTRVLYKLCNLMGKSSGL